MTDFSFASITVVLAAGEELSIDATGSYAHVLAADDAFKWGFDGGALYPVEKGLGVSGPEPMVIAFEAIRLRNTSAAANTITIAWGLGRLFDNRAVVQGGVVVSISDTLIDTSDVSIAAATAGALVAANAARRWLLVQLSDGAAGAARIGGSGVSATKGVKLAPGASINIETRDAVHAYNPNGVAVDFHVLEAES